MLSAVAPTGATITPRAPRVTTRSVDVSRASRPTASRSRSASKPNNSRGFDLVHDEHVDAVEQRTRAPVERGGVEHDAGSGRRRAGDDGLHDVERNLELHDDDVARPQVERADDVGRPGAVRPGDHDDRVLALFVDGDEGRARRAGNAAYPRDVDPGGLEVTPQLLGRGIGADAGHHAHDDGVAREPCCRVRLVAALAAREVHEIGSEERLAGTRQMRHPVDQVEVDAAHDDDPSGWVVPSSGIAPGYGVAGVGNGGA